MVKAILDTSFILTCVRNKIDFFYELEQMGFQVEIPQKVLNEIISLGKNKKKRLRDNAILASKILEKNNFETIELEGKTADSSIIHHAHKNPREAVATLDKEIKSKIKNKKIIVRGKSKIDVV